MEQQYGDDFISITDEDGKEYELDISFKKYKQVESISDEIEKQNIDVDISDFKDSSDFYLYLSKFDDQSSEEISVNVTGKMIAQKNISKISLKLPYICGTIKEQVKNIYNTKEILVGSVNCISTDNQNISAQSLLTAYGKMPLTDEEQAKVNESNVYNDKYIGNFLSLIGTTYFTQLDIENKVLAGANRIYAERYLSYGVFSYEPCVTVSAFSKDIEKKGSFSADILGNYASTVSYRNNADDEYAYRFASGYVSSYLESLVLDELVGIGSLSTAKIFSFALSQGIEIKYISAANKDEIDSLDIYESDKSEVLSAVNNGQTVIVPEKNITFGNWTGTGYIIIDDSENSFAFKLTNGLNGAVNTDYVTADMIGANLCEILEFFFAFQALSAGAAMLATGNIVGSVVMFVLTASLAISAVTYWNDSLKLYNKAMNGDALAAAELAARTKSRCIEDFIFVALGELAEPIAKVFMKIPFVQRLIGSISGAVWELNNKVIASSELYQRYLLKQYAKEEVAKVCGYEVSKKISPELLDSIFKSGQASDIVAILSKYDDEAIVAINKILDKDAVAALIRDYGDDGFKVAVKGGDYLVKAINNLDDDAAELFVKTASKQSDEFFVLMSKYDDIPSWACSDVIDFNSAENVNEILKQNGYTNPPYKPGTNVTTIELTEDTTFVRVYDGEISGKYGGWIMNYNEIKELSPIEIKNRFALQNVPKYICDVKLPKGSRIRFGIANGISEWGNGGGVQFDLMRQEIGEFYNERLLS